MLAKFRFLGGPHDGTEVHLDSLPVLVGRSLEADLALDDRWVSRRHCELCQKDGELAVVDLGSRHGTYLNGDPITEAVLQPGDQLMIGTTRLIASYVASAAADQLLEYPTAG